MSTDVAAGPLSLPRITRQPRMHPPYTEMVQKAIAELKDKSGSSKAAIMRYLVQNYQLGDNVTKINTNIRLALKKGVEKGELKQVSGTGATGSFKLGEKRAPAPKVKKPVVKRADKETNPAPVKKEKRVVAPKEKKTAAPKKKFVAPKEKKPKTDKVPTEKKAPKAKPASGSSKKKSGPKKSKSKSAKSTKKSASAKSK
ncbi:Histone H1-delta [Trichostrongylus colubriformis]|uniref:Histone H1-delta n=1 Tax=Trichostrongylus colubriformis TaxID=6319 RepID=A0AAN8INC7_TRICO